MLDVPGVLYVTGGANAVGITCRLEPTTTTVALAAAVSTAPTPPSLN